jgi:hypothetical protein
MKKKLLLALTCVAWTNAYKAVTMDEIVGEANNISAHTSPNIFEESEFMGTLNNFCNKTNKWVEESLKENKSDTLKKIYTQIKEQTKEIVNRLKEFNSNLNLIKTNDQMLETYRKKMRSFSMARDALKNALKEAQTFYAQNEKAKIRSQGSKDTKAEIANILVTYAERFIDIAQKAITDFAGIDAALFNEIQETNKRLLQEEKKAAASTRTSTRNSDVWSDWDSDLDSSSDSE